MRPAHDVWWSCWSLSEFSRSESGVDSTALRTRSGSGLFTNDFGRASGCAVSVVNQQRDQILAEGRRYDLPARGSILPRDDFTGPANGFQQRLAVAHLCYRVRKSPRTIEVDASADAGVAADLGSGFGLRC